MPKVGKLGNTLLAVLFVAAAAAKVAPKES